jgi:hypothetical protein
MVENPFKFLAFNQDAGEMLAHGRSAIEALASADQAAPSATLIVFPAGKHGAWCWTAKISLHYAQQAFEDSEGYGET